MPEPENPLGTPPPDAFQPVPPRPAPVPAGAISVGRPSIEVPPPPTVAPSSAEAKSVKTPPPHDSFREFLETIVFVVVLVLILKTFLAEAFVIPTGSMATTLLGAHKEVTCEKCGYPFRVNASNEAEHNQPVTGATCPNCFYPNEFGRRPAQGELR